MRQTSKCVLAAVLLGTGLGSPALQGQIPQARSRQSEAAGQGRRPIAGPSQSSTQVAGPDSPSSPVRQAARTQVPAARQPAGQRPAGAQQQPGGNRSSAPNAPFVLTPAQEKFLDQVLNAWEKKSENMNTFKCRFVRWDYDPAFGPRVNNAFNQLRASAMGEIKYKSPDRGVYRVLQFKEFTPPDNAPDPAQLEAKDLEKWYVEKPEGRDHWVCDGESIFQYDVPNKLLKQHRLPPEMRGQAIADGPLPFIFGAKAATLKARYFIRDVTPHEEAGKKIWLEAYPRFQHDAANFQRVVIVLTESTFLPHSIQIELPGGGNRTSYLFDKIQVNDPLSILKGDFLPPRTPLGWTKVVEEPPSSGAGTAANGEPAQDQAQRKGQSLLK